MLLLFSYVSYLIAPNSGSSFTTNHPIISLLLYPLFLFFVLKHFLYLVSQIKINPPYPKQKFTIFTCLLNESLDVSKLKQSIQERITRDDRFKDMKAVIKINTFISYSCPAPKFFVEDHVQIIDGPLEKDASLYHFIELNMMGLFERSQNEPQWSIFIIKSFQNTPVLVFKFRSEYAFSMQMLLELLADKLFPIRNAVAERKDEFEWSLAKNLKLMKRIMDVKAKSEDGSPYNGFLDFLRRMLTSNDPPAPRKQIAFADASLSRILENKSQLQEEHGFLNEREVDFMFDVFKLAGLFIPYKLMAKAFSVLERKYQRMGYISKVKSRREVPGVVKRVYMIDWKEQMFAIGISEQVYGNASFVVLTQNEANKRP